MCYGSGRLDVRRRRLLCLRAPYLQSFARKLPLLELSVQKSYVAERMQLAENFCGVLLSYSYRTSSKNQFIFQQIHLVKQLTLHVSARRCHPQGFNCNKSVEANLLIYALFTVIRLSKILVLKIHKMYEIYKNDIVNNLQCFYINIH